MTPMRCMIVDDDAISRALLEGFVAQTDALELVGSYESSIEAANVLRTTQVDLLFLDVEMPGMSGIELARALTVKPKVILVTGKSEYAVEAFDIEVVDYLIKPASYARFLRAVERTSRELPPRTAAESLGDGAGDPDSLFVKVDGRLVKIPLVELSWVEAKGDYVLLHTAKKRYMVHATMKAVEDRLPSAYLRVHRSHLVRVDRIVDIEDGNLVVERHVIPIGASYRAALLARINPL